MSIRTLRIAVTIAAGQTTGNATSEVVRGEILGVAYQGGAAQPTGPATLDITVATAGVANGVPTYTIATMTNVDRNATGYVAPRATAVDSGGNAITNSHTPFVVSDAITVSLAQGAAETSAAVVWVVIRD